MQLVQLNRRLYKIPDAPHLATWYREAATPRHELQRLGGWKTEAMVERYVHVAPEGFQLAAMRLDSLLQSVHEVSVTGATVNDFAPPYRGPLSIPQVAEGMNAATKNASRLACDARLLLSNKRWPSASSIAVLSIEESGKVVILRRFLTTTDVEQKLLWKEYRSHTRKNLNWILPDLVAKGARTLNNFHPIVDQTSDHPFVLDTVKQLGFYSDCLGKTCHWSMPHDVVEEELATQIVATAELLSPKRNISVRELELWVKHMAPVFGTTVDAMTIALARWYAQMQGEGLAPSGENLMDSFVGEGLSRAQATELRR